MSALSERPQHPSVGVAIPHESAALHVTGAALYTDDLVHRTKDVLHAYPVQVPCAHGRVTALRTEPALAVPGVVRVLTAADVPGVNDAGVKHDEPLFPAEIMFHGHAVCWVLGETLEAARLGALAVEVETQELPALVTVREAIAAGSYQGAQPQLARGDVEAGFARSAHVFSGDFEFAGQEHFYLETHAALAYVDESEQVFIQSSTQHPSETQEIVAHVLGRASNEVTVQCLRMGGGFGGKEMQPHGFAAIAALGAVLTGRPVRLRLNRTQDLTMSGKRHGFYAQWRAGFDDRGLLQALDATLTADGGWSLDLSEPVLARALCHIDNAYWIPDVRVNGRIAKTNKTSNTAFRGFGGPQGMLVIEDILGRCAPLLGLDPMTLRRRNFYRAGQTTPYGQPVRHPERMTAIWDEVTDRAEVGARRREIERFNAAHEHVKRALAVTPVKFGISFNLTAFNQGGALVHVYKDGSVLINHGGTEMGQGLHTKMLQVAATTLGIPLERVRLAPTRTDKVPNTSATAASSGADLNGGAVKNACEQIRSRLLQVAGAVLGANPADIRIVDGSGARARRRGQPAAGTSWCSAPTCTGCSCPRPATTAPKGCTGTPRPSAARRSSTSPTVPPRRRSRWTGSPAPTAPGGSTSCTMSATACRRWSTSARSRAASCRAPAGSRSRSCAGTPATARAAAGSSPRRPAPTSCRASPRCRRSSTSRCCRTPPRKARSTGRRRSASRR